MLKDILQKFDKDIFTDELVEQVQETVEKEISKRVDERTIELNKKYDKVLDEMEEKVDKLSKQYEAEMEEERNKIVENLSTYLEDLKEEVFEENKIDYENVSIVKEAIEVHKANLKIQKLYNIETSEEKVQENSELKKYKSDANKYHAKLKEAEDKALQAEKDLIIYMLAEGMEEEKQDELLAISKSLKDDDINEFKKSLTESKKLLVEKASTKKVDEVKKPEDTKVVNENVPYWKR